MIGNPEKIIKSMTLKERLQVWWIFCRYGPFIKTSYMGVKVYFSYYYPTVKVISNRVFSYMGNYYKDDILQSPKIVHAVRKAIDNQIANHIRIEKGKRK